MSNLMSKPTVKMIQLPRFLDSRGNLSFIEGLNHIPFKINSVYWLYEISNKVTRQAKTYKLKEQFILCLSGCFDVVTVIDNAEKKFTLNQAYVGLYIPNNIWHQMVNFSSNSIALVITSTSSDQ